MNKEQGVGEGLSTERLSIISRKCFSFREIRRLSTEIADFMKNL